MKGGGINTVVMASGAVDDIPRRRGVIRDLLGDTVRDRGFPLVEMLVAVQHEVDAVFEQQRFERCLAFYALKHRVNTTATTQLFQQFFKIRTFELGSLNIPQWYSHTTAYGPQQ